jgi:hypothetical protein
MPSGHALAALSVLMTRNFYKIFLRARQALKFSHSQDPDLLAVGIARVPRKRDACIGGPSRPCLAMSSMQAGKTLILTPLPEPSRESRANRETIAMGPRLNLYPFTVAITITYALWMLDDIPRFFFGDSTSYLATSWTEYLPNDRSWVYGLAVRWLMMTTDSLSSVLLAQAALHAVALSCLAGLLVSKTRAPWVGYLFCAVGVLDPLIVYYVRHIMTDVPAASFFFFFLVALHQVFFANYYSWRRTLFAISCLFVANTIVLTLRVAYLPTVFALCLCFLALSVCRHLDKPAYVRAFAPRMPRVLAAIAAIFLSTVAVIMTNGFLNPQMGFSLNSGVNSFSLGVFAPAIQYDMLKKEGFVVDQVTFENFHLNEMELRTAQIFAPAGLVATLTHQLRGRPNTEIDDRFRQLRNRIFTENPLGVAKIFAYQFLIQVNPIEYVRRFNSYAVVDRRIFDENFVERYIHPNVWQKIDRTLPGQPTLSEKYVVAASVVVWLQYLLAVISPLGLVLVLPSFRQLYGVLAIAVNGYAISTVAISVTLVPRYFVPIGPLSAALFLLLFASVVSRVTCSRTGRWPNGFFVPADERLLHRYDLI